MFFAALLNLSISFFGSASFAQNAIEPDWSSQASIDPLIFPHGRSNIYQWDEKTFAEKVKRGVNHALHYPVIPTGLLVPARPALKMLDAQPGDPIFGLMKAILSLSSEFQDFKGFWDWLGLTPPREDSGEQYPMGVSIVTRQGAQGFTLSCAACHSSELFGKPVIGMTNRFSRANLFFMHGQKMLGKVSPGVFQLLTGATRAEKEMYRESADKIISVGLKKPVVLGLDTSLAQVALSLSKRAPSPDAERTSYDASHPRSNELETLVADSKPAVWWNTKYKTRWLSDASVLSGNPVFTNFLWNEIGRGVDLPELITWLEQNQTIVQELTTAVFATEAPKWKDFIGEHTLNIERAKRGQILFTQSCAKCHGDYEKAWNLNPSQWENLHERAVRYNEPMPSITDTLQVKYDAATETHDVGTDPGRRQGMKVLGAGLNPLAFSKKYNVVIEEQSGYVAPPLVGIWARYPYFHNNSIPNLCALLTPPASRPKQYYSGKAIDPVKDYDQECVGYPLGTRTPSEWKKDREHLYDTSIAGLSNAGHYKMLLNSDGSERYSSDQKKDLIEFLKTL